MCRKTIIDYSQVTRGTLESELSLRQAKDVIDKFCNDREIYPDRDIYLRRGTERGVLKILAEEYHPLICLAKKYWGVRSVRLFPEGNPGPDAEIWFWWRFSSKVQITCSNENQDSYFQRKLLEDGHIVFQSQKREIKSGKVEATGRILSSPEVVVQNRVARIVEAIRKKESNFHSGTDTLIVQEDLANFRHLIDGNLHSKVCAAIENGLSTPYKRIYVNYGDDLKRIK